MLEVRSYTKQELAEMLGSASRQSIKNKLNRYGVKHTIEGRGDNTVFHIEEITNEFKVFCILELGMDARTDFHLFLHFMYYLLNDDEFLWRPNETLELMMDKRGNHISRQTISKYKEKLTSKGYMYFDTNNIVYYFALHHVQTITTRENYLDAWNIYWEGIYDGDISEVAMGRVIEKYGGCPRKQFTMGINAFYLDKMNKLNDLIVPKIMTEMINASHYENILKQAERKDFEQ